VKTVYAFSSVDSFASWIFAYRLTRFTPARAIRPGDVGAARAQPESGIVTKPGAKVGGGAGDE
jgi:hypothetical protein